MLKDIKLFYEKYGYNVAIAGTFNIMPARIKENICDVDFDTRHVNIEKPTIQYKNPSLMNKKTNTKHVDYGLFWGFNEIEENICSIENSYHSMVSYHCVLAKNL